MFGRFLWSYMTTNNDILILTNISINTRLRWDRWAESLEQFLVAHKEDLQLPPDGDLVQEYFQRLWPDGLPASAIVSNMTQGEFPRWLLRPPVEGPQASSFAAKNRAPAFSAYRRQAQLVVDGFQVVPHVAPRVFESVVSGPMHLDADNQWISKEDFEQLLALPRPMEQVATQLAAWREYLDWREKLARLRRVELRFGGFRVTGNGAIEFEIVDSQDSAELQRQLGQALLLAAPTSASRSPLRWDPPPEQRRRFVRVGKVTGVTAGPGHDRSGRIVISTRPDGSTAEDVADDLSDSGFLLSAIFGDIKPLRSERNGISRLLGGQAHNPVLPAWLFDISNAAGSVPADLIQVQEDILEHLDSEQREALFKALAAPDVFLLQGPPGTGKTTFIAALCMALARGGARVLVASQTNLAVDNALDRLRADLALLPLRVGKAHRIDQEFKHLLSEHVVTLHFQQVRATCEERMQRHEELQRRVRRAKDRLRTLHHAVESTTGLQQQVSDLEVQIAELRRDRETIQEQRQAKNEQLERHGREARALKDIVQWAQRPDRPAPGGSLLENGTLTEPIKELLSVLTRTAQHDRWTLRWLAAELTATVAAGLQAITRARTIQTETLTPLVATLREAASLAAGIGDESCHAQEFEELRATKARLLNSEREEDLLQVAQINRRINRLRDKRWSALGGAIRTHLEGIFGTPLPADLEQLTAALQPVASHVAMIESLITFCEHLASEWPPTIERGVVAIAEVASTAIETGDVAAESDRAVRDRLRERIAQLDAEIDGIGNKQVHVTAQIHACEERWAELWPEVCPDLDEPGTVPAVSADALQERQQTFEEWRSQHQAENERWERWHGIRQEWCQRLADPAQINGRELQDIYRRLANIVGILYREAETESSVVGCSVVCVFGLPRKYASMAGIRTKSAINAVPIVHTAMLANILCDGKALISTVPNPVTNTSVVVIKAVPTVTNVSRNASPTVWPWPRK